jgi:hypothetical protein
MPNDTVCTVGILNSAFELHGSLFQDHRTPPPDSPPRRAYYVANQPEISDAEFDDLMRELPGSNRSIRRS